MKFPKLKLSDLWRWDGTMGPQEYFTLGVVLFFIKFNIDRLVAAAFGNAWSLLSYISGPPNWMDPVHLKFFLTMVAVALPFIWSGTVLTLRRLRSAGLPGPLVFMFFLPFANLLFFGLLSIVAPRDELKAVPQSDSKITRIMSRIIPPGKFGSAAAAVFISSIVTIAGTALDTMFLGIYGFGLFVGLPFFLGMISVSIYGFKEKRSFRDSMVVCLYSVLIAGGALLAVAFEGVICLIMAAPLAICLAMLGGSVAYAILRTGRWNQEAGKVFSAALLAVPLTMAMENLDAPDAPILRVQSAVDVKAPPETVWRHVVRFSELPPPRDFLFHVGIAYPIRARINGVGVGAVRRCEFSTGPFVEPIQVWDEPHLLKFSVTENPAPLEEWTPYHHIEPPHLSGFLVSEGGQFLLTENPDGTTHLEGTTWYRHHMWPAGYWQIWSDYIIHRIHLRVLNHVKMLAEKEAVR